MNTIKGNYVAYFANFSDKSTACFGKGEALEPSGIEQTEIKSNKSRLTSLINELVNNNLSEEDEKRVCSEIDSLSLDPLWSDYIYWSNDYLLDDNSLDIDKLVDKITKTNEM